MKAQHRIHLHRAGRRRLARDRLATARARIRCPTRAQGVEYEGISRCNLAWVRNDLIGVIDNRIARDTPGFVSDNPGAVLACRLRTVAVAVELAGWGAIGHRHLLALFQRSRSASGQLSANLVCIVANAENDTLWVTSHEFVMDVTSMHWKRSTEADYHSSSHEMGCCDADEFPGNDYLGIFQNARKYYWPRVIKQTTGAASARSGDLLSPLE